MPNEPEEETLVICTLAGESSHFGFDDDVYGACAKCSARIKWRPHSPPGSRKVCLSCGLAEMQPDCKIGITPETIAEVRAYLTLKEATSHTKKKGVDQ